MFWYIFLIVISSLVIAASFIVRRMSRNAGELNIVTETFQGSGSRGAKFCFISDIHISMMPVRWGDILAAIREEEPEFLVVTGDLVNKTSDIERAKQFILTLSLGLGIPVIITMGNHDGEVADQLPGGRAEFIDAFTSLKGDVRIASDGYTMVGNVLIGGLNDASFGTDEPDNYNGTWRDLARDNDLAFVLATHNADILLKCSGGSADGSQSGTENSPSCVLCGHTHGGQIRMVRNVEFKMIKKDELPKRGIFYGRHNVNGFDLYITSGLGCALFPLRHGTRPEVVVVKITPMC